MECTCCLYVMALLVHMIVSTYYVHVLNDHGRNERKHPSLPIKILTITCLFFKVELLE